MRTVFLRLAGLLLAFVLLQLSSCAPLRHDAQATGQARHRYHRAERRNEHRRRRFVPPHIPWSRIQYLDSCTARNWAVQARLYQP